MAKTPIELEMNQMPVKEIQVDVTLHMTKLFKLRLWLGLTLLDLVGRIWDCHMDIVYVDDPSRITEVER